MAATALNRSFERHAEKRAPAGAQYSLEREPWRAFRSSLAVQFTSRRKGGWSPGQLSDQAQAEITLALESRRSIIRTYSEIHSIFVDFLQQAGALPPPAERFGWSSRDELAFARKRVAAGAALAPQAPIMSEMIEEVETLSDKFDLVVRGLVEVREEKSGEIRFLIELWGKRQTFTCAELQAEAAALETFSRKARNRLATFEETL